MAIPKDVRLGANVVIHHADLVNLYGCSAGEGSKIGTLVDVQKKNAVIDARCKISSRAVGEGSMAGAGAVSSAAVRIAIVFADAAPGATVMGVPARAKVRA